MKDPCVVLDLLSILTVVDSQTYTAYKIVLNFIYIQIHIMK